MNANKAVNILKNAGYNAVQRTPYHVQVLMKTATINIWPTANKILKQYEQGPVKKYTNLLEAVTEEVTVDLSPLRFSSEMEQLMNWREDPINRLKEYVESL